MFKKVYGESPSLNECSTMFKLLWLKYTRIIFNKLILQWTPSPPPKKKKKVFLTEDAVLLGVNKKEEVIGNLSPN